MSWRAHPIRTANDAAPDGEAVLCPAPSLGVPLLSGPERAGSGRVGPRPFEAGIALLAAKEASSHSNARPSPQEDGVSGAKGSFLPQPSDSDRVPENMATLVLDNPSLGAGRPDAWPVAAGLDPGSDAAIMLRVAAGDESGFNYLAEKYHRPIIHFLFRMVRNQAIAEELAQEVFLRVYRSRESYRAEAKFTTWLYRIATNLAVNHARDTKHERAARNIYLDAPDEESGATPDVADDEPSAEQRLVRDERMMAIRKHVMALPERQRMAVVMHKYQGMDYREIGEVLKQSESATKSLLFRAYQTLREKLKDFV